MLDQVRTTLERLRISLSRKAEQAYDDRDAERGNSRAAAYAEGEAHAYGLASDEVREAQNEDRR